MLSKLHVDFKCIITLWPNYEENEYKKCEKKTKKQITKAFLCPVANVMSVDRRTKYKTSLAGYNV